MLREAPDGTHRSISTAGDVQLACLALWEQIKTYLYGIRSKPLEVLDEYDIDFGPEP
ncbi:hypothetical protein [Arthrobacter sp. UYCo732]|uniref:hypothetical protein n=1 Tax=Arthrobacter sp. UYCo732 TaxID=3156336 RepID=UPI0033933F16